MVATKKISNLSSLVLKTVSSSFKKNTFNSRLLSFLISQEASVHLIHIVHYEDWDWAVDIERYVPQAAGVTGLESLS